MRLNEWLPARRRWLRHGVLAVIVVSVAAWYCRGRRDALPSKITLATAEPGGLYHEFGKKVGPFLKKETGREVLLKETEGSVENAEELRKGEVDLAILQAGAVDMDGLVALAPLYPDVVHVIVRRNLRPRIHSINDLVGRSVSLGKLGSGMRKSAVALLEQYSVKPKDLTNTDCYFHDLATEAHLEAAIATTGFLNRDLLKLLRSGDFEILPVPDAQALSLRHAYFSEVQIPQGLYSKEPDLPPESLTTVATVAFLATRQDASKLLVQATLRTLYERFDHTLIPTLLGSTEAAKWSLVPLHPAARAYHQPYKGLDTLANLVSSLTGIKELLLAIGAGLYMLCLQRRRYREAKADAVLDAQKSRMDALLEATIRVERAQMDTEDPEQLKQFLDQVTSIKLKALEELTDEGLRSDHRFSIFLMQCGNVIRKIQGKLLLLSNK